MGVIITNPATGFGGDIDHPLYVIYLAKKFIKWITKTSFDKGSYTDTEVNGTGEEACVALEDNIDNDDNITFSDQSEYTLSDANKLQVINGKGRLKATVAGEGNWNFDVEGEYTFPSELEVTGGVGKLTGIPLIPHALYHLNETTGLVAADSSGNGRNGACVQTEDSDWVAGKLNNCLRFNEGETLDEYISCGSSTGNFELNDRFSIEFWIKVLGWNSGNIRVAWKYNGSTGYLVFISASRMSIFFLDKTLPGYIQLNGSTPIDLDTWYHVVFTYDGSGIANGVELYVNSNLETKTVLKDDIAGGSIISPATFNLGGTGASYFLNGYMDEVVIYDNVLSLSQVQERYNSGNGTENLLGGFNKEKPSLVTNIGYPFSFPITTFSETAIKPAGTELKYQLSSDDGATRKYWNGSAWVARTSGQTDEWYYDNDEVNLATVISANISTLAGSGTLKVIPFFRSNDTGDETPELDNTYIAEQAVYSLDDNLFIETKDASQINPATILAWLTAIFTVTKPANTDIRIQFSNDGRTTWLKWSGSTWVTVSSATRAEATDYLVAAANFALLFLGSSKLDVRAFFYTTDPYSTGEIDNINILSDNGFKISGEYESNIYDSYYYSLEWGKVEFSITLKTGATLILKARASNDNTIMSSYSGALVNGQETNLTGRYIQWKGEFATTGLNSAEVDSIGFNFTSPSVNEVQP
jgi:hypothetical protein